MGNCLISLETRRAELWLGEYRQVTTEDQRELLRQAHGTFEYTREVHTVWDEWAIDGKPYTLFEDSPCGWTATYESQEIIVTCPLPYGFSPAELRMQERRRFTLVRYRSSWLTRLCASMRIPWPPRDTGRMARKRVAPRRVSS
jgi:hypothetical protein